MQRTPVIHKLKTWPEHYEQVINGTKKFEVRRNDRDFQIGDILLLEEFDPYLEAYTSHERKYVVTFILEGGKFGIAPTHVVMSIEEVWPQ